MVEMHGMIYRVRIISISCAISRMPRQISQLLQQAVPLSTHHYHQLNQVQLQQKIQQHHLFHQLQLRPLIVCDYVA